MIYMENHCFSTCRHLFYFQCIHVVVETYDLICYIMCRWLSSKEIHKEDIKYWRREIPRLMCEMKKYISSTFFNEQEHYLIHQVDDIEMPGPVHTRSMWMVERHLKSLKAFVRKKTHLEVSMVERYMTYQYLVYISQHLPKLAAKIIKVPRIWDVNSINKFEEEVLVRKDRMRKVKSN
jgi:hypothetical protein